MAEVVGGGRARVVDGVVVGGGRGRVWERLAGFVGK